MAKGRSGFWLEGGKFAVYLMIPIAASIHYNNPANQRKAADYWQYVRYPANPSTGWKEHIEQAAQQQEQRQAYRKQLEILNSNNSTMMESTATSNSEISGNVSTTNGGWGRWIGWGNGSSHPSSSASPSPPV